MLPPIEALLEALPCQAMHPITLICVSATSIGHEALT